MFQPSNTLLDMGADDVSINYIRSLISHPAWNEFFVPYLLKARADAIEQLLDPSQDRKEHYPDDFLRAQVLVIDKLVTEGPNRIADYDANRQRDENLKARDEDFSTRAALGRVGPLQ